jgi:hypothetical protein
MASSPTVRSIETPAGPARVHLHRVARARGAPVLGHGAGGGVAAPDLLAATSAAVAEAVRSWLERLLP